MIYFDNAATTPMLPVVKAKMKELIDLDLGNASSLHSAGQRAKQILEDARNAVARLIGAEPSEIVFTSGGSEANNAVMATFADCRIAVSRIEHPSVLEPAKHYAKRLEYIDVDTDGRVDPAKIPYTGTALVSVLFASNELGTIEPVAEIAAICHRHGALCHTDATQAIGKLHLDVKRLGVDYLTFSAHKLGGPIGIGALYIKSGSPYRLLILGGHQENARRAGTSNPLLAAGFGAAAAWCHEHQSHQKYRALRSLRDRLAERILAEIPHSSLNSPLDGSLPHLLNVSFRAAEGESIQLYLDAAGVAVSTGSACAAGDIAPSHVLMATKHDAEVAHSSIRFSLGLGATMHDIDEVMRVLPSIIARLQGISTIKIGDQ